MSIIHASERFSARKQESLLSRRIMNIRDRAGQVFTGVISSESSLQKSFDLK